MAEVNGIHIHEIETALFSIRQLALGVGTAVGDLRRALEGIPDGATLGLAELTWYAPDPKCEGQDFEDDEHYLYELRLDCVEERPNAQGTTISTAGLN